MKMIREPKMKKCKSNENAKNKNIGNHIDFDMINHNTNDGKEYHF